MNTIQTLNTKENWYNNKTEELLKLKNDTLSINSFVGDEEETELVDFIPSENDSPEDLAINKAMKDSVLELLDNCNLKDREKNVIILRFGLDGNEPRTLEEVGNIYNLTRERIRQIEAKALRKLRHPSRSKKLKDYM